MKEAYLMLPKGPVPLDVAPFSATETQVMVLPAGTETLI
jgi:hypothetical protein